MLPTLKQRLMIAGGVLVGGLCWLLASSAVMPTGGASGITLIDARAGFVGAAVAVALAGIPAGLLAMGLAAMANPLAGVFTVAASLWMLAAYGGDSGAFLWRVEGPGAYGWLIVELGVWTALHAGVLVGMSRCRLPVRRRLPGLISPAHQTRSLTRDALRLSTAAACVVTTVVAAVLCRLMIRDTDAGQVLGSLALAFAGAGLVGRMVVPGASALGVLLSPLLLAVVGYGYVMMGFGSSDALLAAWYGNSLPGLAWTLPIHYASAGMVGCTLGVGMAQAVEAARLQTA